MSRQTILLIFGGESSEHDVSVMSGRNVYAAIDHQKYQIELVFIDRAGKWWLLSGWPDDLEHHEGEELLLVPGEKQFLIVPGNTPMQVDLLLPILHGENGHEDGMIQGIGQMLHIPVIGSGIGASAICWDKRYTKQLLAANGINVTPYVVVQKSGSVPAYDEVASQLGEIMFIKPTIAGSSIGVSKVHTKEEFLPAIKTAFEHSETILIEKAIEGRELEIAVLGTPPNHTVSDVGEIIPGEEFYSYEDKYSPSSKAQVLSSAALEDDLRETIRTTAHTAYEVIGCNGLARVDFLLSEDGQLYLNEFNTLPGFTSISQYPKLWQEQGLGFSALIDQLITLAQE